MSLMTSLHSWEINRRLSGYRFQLGQFDFSEIADMYKLVAANLTYEGSFNRAVLDNWKAYTQALRDCSAVSSQPIPGHRVRVICKNGKVYEKALICREYGSAKAICMNAGAHICRPTLSNTGALSMSVSGGYFHWHKKLETIRMVPDGTVDVNYWFWGESAGANRGIYLNFPMRRWLIDDSNGELGFY